MTRFIHDQFAKDYLEALLKSYGEVQAPLRVASEVREIDVLFTPNNEQISGLSNLGLLGKFANYPAIFEPFRNAAPKEEICDCLLKLLDVRSGMQREAKRSKIRLLEKNVPKLWVLTPTASKRLLSGFGATQGVGWLPGVYLMAEYLRTAIVAIHQLPSTTETLWLRLLGRGTVQKVAINELEALPSNHPHYQATLEQLYNLQQNLAVNENIDKDDKELVMRLAPLYQQDRELAKQEGEQRLIIRLLNRRFGEIDASLIEQIQGLSIDQLELLGDALLDFTAISDLETWLNQ
jgi:hypothetical protein